MRGKRFFINMNLMFLLAGSFYIGCSGKEKSPDCVPDNCASLWVECGNHFDNCSEYINCGECNTGYQCVEGFCVAVEQTCADIEPCDDPPADECTGNVLVTYPETGDCEETDAGPVCVYPESTHDCGDSHVCLEEGTTAYCEPIQITCADIEPCDDPPADECTGNVLVTYPETGDCEETDAGPVCVYPESTHDCGDSHVCVEEETTAYCEPIRLTCADPGVIECGDVIIDDTTGAPNLINSYPSCTSFPQTGGEHVYTFVPEESGEVTVDLTELFADLDLLILEGGCDGGLCIAYSAGVGDEQVVFDGVAGTTYYIVVDGYDGAHSSYTLSLTCSDPDDECEGVGYEGCCDGSVVYWCEDGTLYALDCSQNIPPDDICGWSEADGFFDCGGSDPVPVDIVPDCPWGCTPDCTGLDCGPDPICGVSCGVCGEGFLCDEGICVPHEPFLTCADPGFIDCGNVIMDDTTGSPNLINSYPSCTMLTHTGGEHVYAFVPQESGEVTVDLTELFADLDLFILEGVCDGGFCIAYSAGVGDEQVVFDGVAGTTYYIVVDGYAGAHSSYTLSLTCSGDQTDLCENMPLEGCCDGDVVHWCEAGVLYSHSCTSYDPPFNTCGWDDFFGYFYCGGSDPVPGGMDPDCPWVP